MPSPAFACASKAEHHVDSRFGFLIVLLWHQHACCEIFMRSWQKHRFVVWLACVCCNMQMWWQQEQIATWLVALDCIGLLAAKGSKDKSSNNWDWTTLLLEKNMHHECFDQTKQDKKWVELDLVQLNWAGSCIKVQKWRQETSSLLGAWLLVQHPFAHAHTRSKTLLACLLQTIIC